MSERRRGLLWGLAFGAITTLLLVAAGLWLGGVPVLGGENQLTGEARSTIEDNYFHPVTSEQLDDGAVSGMVGEVSEANEDRFSHYFTEEELRAFDASTNGEFSGVGLGVSEVPAGLRVATVFAGSPAAEAGIERGDLITAVDGRSIEGVSSEVSAARIKGEPGTEVTLTVEPNGGGAARDVTVERAAVHVPAVRGKIEQTPAGDVAHVRFGTFSRDSADELRDEIGRLRDRGAEGLVLDLRGNGGGLLDEAVAAASVFVDDGTIVTTRSRTQGDRVYEAAGDAIAPIPAVVLINRDTASAAEILVAAMQYHDVATIIGTRSYGKGTFQQVFELGAGGALDLTVGEYIPASGVSILGTGVQPDVKAKDDPETAPDEALQQGLRNLAPLID